MTCLVGVDVGASGVRAQVELDGEARPRLGAADTGVSISQGVAGLPRLAETIGDVVSPLTKPETPGVVCLGSAALVALGDGVTRLAEDLAERLGVARVVIASDAVTSYLGALGPRPGAVVAAGTGAVAFGRDDTGRWHRVDGWGYLLGDEGSGAWIGMAGARAALRAHDGRPGGSRRLLDLLEARYGEIERVPAAVHPWPDRAARIAAFVPDVAAAARAGDLVAGDIWRRAGHLLAEAVVAALPEGLDQPRVSWAGGLFEVGELLLVPLRARLAQLRPDAELCAPRGVSLDGAVELARLAADPTSVLAAPPYVTVYDAPA